MFWQLIFVLILLIPLLSIVLDSHLGRALAQRVERRGLPGSSEDLVADRIAFLEGEVERLSGDVRRLEEESRFLQNLLAERPPQGALPEGERGD